MGKNKMKNSQSIAKRGDRIAMSYACFDADGNELENSGGEFETVIGAGDILPALEKALVGMAPGEEKSVVLPPAKAFGLRDEDAMEYVPLNLLPEGIEEGEMVELIPEGENEPVQGIVAEIGDDDALVDLNHPYAGATLRFELKLVEIL